MKKLQFHSKEFHSRPHTHLAWMREHAPVYKAKFGAFRDVYLVTRYNDVKSLLSDNRLVKNIQNVDGKKRKGAFWLPKMLRPLLQNMLTQDDPQHRRLRQLVQMAFTPKIINGLHEQIEFCADELYGRIDTSSTVDFVEAFALPLPIRVITELVGVPAEEVDLFMGWMFKMLRRPTPVNMLLSLPAMRKLFAYIHDLADRKRKNPQEDLLSGLVLAEEEGSRLSADELVAMIFLIISAGHETTVSLMTNGLRALITHPDEFNKLRKDPGLVESAVEEMLRFDSPLLTTELYYAREPLSLHGTTIPAGEAVLLAVLSANRDAEIFEEPDTFDITRSPNPHLAFGRGKHFCLGASLARLEGKIAFQTLLRRTEDIQLAIPEEKLSYHSFHIVNKLKALPIRITDKS